MSTVLKRIAFMLACLLTAALETRSQVTRIDVSQCFPEILQTKLTIDELTKWQYYYLSIVDEDTYKKMQASHDGSALTPWGWFKGTWDAFQEDRRHFFALHNESMSYYRAQFTDFRYLPPEWQGVINNCINRLTDDAKYGLSYFPVLTYPKLIRLELKFKSTGKDFPRVRSSQIVNGSLDDGGKITSLYRACRISGVDWTCPSINDQSEFFIRRLNPNEKISINLNFDDPKFSTGLDIDPTPKKVHCEKSYAHSPVKEETHRVDVHSGLLPEYYGPDNDRYQVWWLKNEFPGNVLNASCVAYDSHNIKFGNDPRHVYRWRDEHGMSSNPDWQDNVVRCMGIVQTSDPRSADITAKFQVPGDECTEIDW
jgi:hypothetical protein